MNHSIDVLRVEENGVEYFTITATGESGMSQRGLARACGKDHKTIKNLINNLGDEAPSRILKPWIGKGLTLENVTAKKNGKNVIVYHADFCSDVITHYAFLGSEAAQDIVAATNKIGLTSYIQGKTKWLPLEYLSSEESRQRVARILDEPCPYEALYRKEMCNRAFGWFGANFYWDFFYFWMDADERAKLEQSNPVINGRRRSRIHQWIEPTTKERLRDKAYGLGALIIGARSKQQFLDMFQSNYGQGWQMDIFE